MVVIPRYRGNSSTPPALTAIRPFTGAIRVPEFGNPSNSPKSRHLKAPAHFCPPGSPLRQIVAWNVSIHYNEQNFRYLAPWYSSCACKKCRTPLGGLQGRKLRWSERPYSVRFFGRAVAATEAGLPDQARKRGPGISPGAPSASPIVLAIEDVHRELKTETLVLVRRLGPLHYCISLRITSRGCHPPLPGKLINFTCN